MWLKLLVQIGVKFNTSAKVAELDPEKHMTSTWLQILRVCFHVIGVILNDYLFWVQ